MKKKKFVLSILSLVGVLGLNLVSCNKVETIKGEPGEQGPIGPAGENGSDGKDGSIIHTGEGKPSDTLGKDTDLYIDSTTGDLYSKSNGSWSLTMNIKGEDGKDGQDGHDGINGSSGSDGKTAWSNTILPSQDGYITSSIGSGFVNDTVKFSFNPNTTLTTNESILWSVLDKNGESVADTDDDPLTFETTMKEGGFVVSAQIVEGTVQTVQTTKELTETLSNLQEGDNYIILDEDITLDAEDFESPSTQSISTFANNNDDIKNFFKTGKIVLKNKNKNKANVKIIANGKGKTFTFPLLTIEAENIDTFTFNNVNLVCDFDLSKIGKPIDGFGNFINASGVNCLEFNNVTFKLQLNETYSPEEYMLSAIPSFFNFDGEEIKINNFKQYQDYASFSWGFLPIDTRNTNLKSIDLNNVEVYTSIPFMFAFDFTTNDKLREINVNVNNSTFYNCYPDDFMNFISLFSEYSNVNQVNLKLNMNFNNVNYNHYWSDDSYKVVLSNWPYSIIDIVDYYYGYNGPFDNDTLLKLDINPFAVNYRDKVNINLNNYYENGYKVEADDQLKVLPEENLPREVIRRSELDKGRVNYSTEALESLRLKNKRYYITQKVKPVNCNNNYEEPLSAISFEINKYPTLTVNNTNIYGN